MLRRKKLCSSKVLKVLFAVFFAVGFLSCSRAGELNAEADAPTGSLRPEVLMPDPAASKKPLVLFHEQWKHRSLNLFAAYEEPWRDSAVRAKITDGHQEGGCAFIKASFSF
jgi:hypothetical protein